MSSVENIIGWVCCFVPVRGALDEAHGHRQRTHPTALLVMLLWSVVILTGCVSSGEEPTVSLASGNLIVDESHADGGAWGLPDCSACHALSTIHGDADLIRGITKDKGFDTCAGCHGSNGTSIARRCIICHNSTDLPTAPRQQGRFSHHYTRDVAGTMNDADCLSCHDASDMDGRFELNQDLTHYPDQNRLITHYSSLSDFCLRCHNRDHQQPGYEITDTAYEDPLIAIEEAFIYVDKHGAIDGLGTRTYAGLRGDYSYASEVPCTDCHAMHGTENGGLILDSTATGFSLLNESQTYDVITNGTDYTQLCVVCHLMETLLDDGATDAGNGLSGVHQVGGDCYICHSHGESIQAGM